MAKEVRAKVVLEGDTSELNKQIEATTEKVKQLKKEFSLQDAADHAAKAIRERASVQQELIRRGVIADPKVIEQKKAEELRNIEQARTESLAAQSRTQLAMTGLSLSGFGGVAGGYGHGLSVGSALEGMGLAGASRFAGPAGAAIAAAGMRLEYLRKTERYRADAVNANPYYDEAARGRGMFAALPGGQTFLDYHDTFSGRTAGFERNSEKTERLQIQTDYNSRSFNAIADIKRQQANAKARADAIQQLPRPIMPTFDRSTPEGLLKTREAEALHGPRTQAVMAERELRAATADRLSLEQKGLELTEKRRVAAINVTSQEKLTNHFLELQKKSSNDAAKSIGSGPFALQLRAMWAKSGAKPSGNFDFSVAIDESRQKFDAFKKEDLELSRKQQQIIRDVAEAKQREAQAAHSKAMSEIDIKRAELQNLKGREEFAAGTAQRLGGMGVGDRMVSMEALRYIKSSGTPLEFIPGGMVDAASMVAPLEIAKLREQSGVAYSQNMMDELRQLAPDDAERGPHGLAELRRKVNAGEVEAGERGQEADTAFGSAVQKGSDALKGIERLLGEELPMLFQMLDNKFRLVANGINQ